MYSVVLTVEVGDAYAPEVAGDSSCKLDILHDDAGHVEEAVPEEVNVELNISACIADNDDQSDEEREHYEFEA